MTPPGRLGDRPAADHRDRAAQVVERHVVEQHGVDAGAQRLVELGQRVDLDLDLDEMADMRRARAGSPRATPPATATWLSLISTASSRPKRWLAPPPARTAYFSSERRPGVVLRVQTMRAFVCRDRRDEPRGRGGDAAEPAQEIERHALGRQHAARGPVDRSRRRAGRDARAVGQIAAHADRRVDEAEGERGSVEPGDDALPGAPPSPS